MQYPWNRPISGQEKQRYGLLKLNQRINTKILTHVKVLWKYLLNGDKYYFGWDEIIFSKQAARPFLYLDANHEMQSLKWPIGSKIRLKWTVPWFSVFVDQKNLKIIWKFSLSQYRCHKTPIDVENCVKSALNSNHRKQNFTVITNWGAHSGLPPFS